MDIDIDMQPPVEVSNEATELIGSLESENRLRMIDYALETKNQQLFNVLTEGLQQI